MPAVPDKPTDRPNRMRRFEAAVRERPDDTKALVRLGTALLQTGRMNEAEAHLRHATEVDPTCIEAWVNLGGLLMSRWDFAGCVEANRRALGIDPNLIQAHYNEGLGHLYAGDAERMVGCFSRVVELDPQHAGGLYHLAVGQLAMKRAEDALATLKRSMLLGYSPKPEFLKALEKEVGAARVPEPQSGHHPKG